MISATPDNQARCTLCPAMCPLLLGWCGPDIPRVEYQPRAGTGLCPRGSALGDLMASARRIRWPRRRQDGRLVELTLPEGIQQAARRMTGGAVVLLDGNLPIEELASAAAVARAWPAMQLCLAVAPDDEQLLLGVEASGAAYLADEELARCDGFVLVGDVFAANPRCAAGVLDAVKANPRIMVVSIDSGGGVTGNFGVVKVVCRPGGELDALQSPKVIGAVSACRKLGVVVSTDMGRGGIWRQVGHAVGKLANAHGGGVSVQTVGANALAAVRARAHLGLLSLAQAMSPAGGEAIRVAIGVDALGMLGWSGPAFPVAAGALPNRTTDSAEIILPLALPCEMGGAFLQAGTRQVASGALLAAPAAVPTPGELLRLLAEAAGVRVPVTAEMIPVSDRLSLPATPAPTESQATGRVLTGARLAMHHGEGALTGQADWQSQGRPLPELRVSPGDAAELGLSDLDEAEVETDSGHALARVRIVPNLAGGTLAVASGYAEARQLMPYAIDAERDQVASPPAAVSSVVRASARAPAARK